MSKIPSFGVRRPVVANLVMLAIIGSGLLAAPGLTREFFPETRPTQVSVAAPYPGAAPEEVEEALAVKIEDAVRDITGVEEFTSTVREGSASVLIEFRDGFDIDAKVAEVKREMDALQDLPDQVDDIVVDKIEAELPAIILALRGRAPPRELKRAIREIREDLRDLPGMGTMRLGGVKRDEIAVEVRPSALLKHGLSLGGVADQINRAMIEQPGGSVRTATSNVALRTLGVDERASAVRGVVIESDRAGRVVRLGDIAEVSDTFADVPTISRLNGEPAVNLTVFQSGDDDYVTMADMVKAYAAGRRGGTYEPTLVERFSMVLALGRARGELGGAEDEAQRQAIRDRLSAPWQSIPVSARHRAYLKGLERSSISLPGTLTITTDLSRVVTGRLSLLTRNAAFGGVLVLIVLVLLLNWRVSFWVAAGLAVSLLGTLTLMWAMGDSLNVISMFGLIIVIGILVDDAIVVAENITARHEGGEPALAAAINGARQVEWPVVATVLTTIGAFMPLALIEGQIGDLLGVLPVVVAVALAVSLIESLFILPSHMGHSLKHADKAHAAHREGVLSRLDHRLDAWREWLFGRVVTPFYLGLLRPALRRPYTSALIAVALLVVSVGMVSGKRLEFIFFEEDDAETISIELVMPVGTSLDRTAEVLERLETGVAEQPEVASYFTTAGAISSLDGSGLAPRVSTHVGQIIVELMPVESRDRASPAIVSAIRDEVGELTGVKSLRIASQQGGPSGPGLSYTIVGDSRERIEAAAEAMMDRMRTYRGVVDISTDSERGQRELRFELREGATGLGFTRAGLGRQIQGFALGIEAFTFAGDREDVDVRVMLPEDQRRSLSALEDQYVYTPAGEPVPLGEVAEIRESEAYATIRRLNGRRSVSVTADVDRATGANPDEVSAALAPFVETLPQRFPGIGVELRGRQEDFQESFSTLPLGMAVAAGIIYIILAWLFGSYTQPLVVMAAIPFASIGMIWGHLLLGYSLTFLSLIGFVALSGIVVNDSLIFTEFYNGKRRSGQSVRKAALEAGRARVRAILLTTITTVIGLTPLLLEQSFQAKFLIPMAIAISAGLISATGVILVVLPCLLVIASDLQRWLASAWSGRVIGELPPPGPVDVPGETGPNR